LTEHENIREIMEETPGGENHGRRAIVGRTDQDAGGPVRERVSVSTSEHQSEEFMRAGGFSVVHAKSDGGLVAHRGVLHEDEYVNPFELQRQIEAELGFTYAQARAVYRQGPLSSEQRQLREQIDARLLALRRSGGNLTELAKAIGFAVNANGNVRIIERAIERARAVEQWRANELAANPPSGESDA